MLFERFAVQTFQNYWTSVIQFLRILQYLYRNRFSSKVRPLSQDTFCQVAYHIQVSIYNIIPIHIGRLGYITYKVYSYRPSQSMCNFTLLFDFNNSLQKIKKMVKNENKYILVVHISK